MARITWPLVVVALVAVAVQYMPWPVRSQPHQTYRAESAPTVNVTCASPAPGQPGAAGDSVPPAPKVQPNSQPSPAADGEPLLPPPSPAPSVLGESVEQKLKKVEQKLIDSFKVSLYPAGPQDQVQIPPPPAPAPLPPPSSTDVPPPPPSKVPTPPGTIRLADDPPPQPPLPAPEQRVVPTPPPMAQTLQSPALPGPVPPPAPFYPDPTQKPAKGHGDKGNGERVIGDSPKDNPIGDPPATKITSLWTFHLEIVDGKNVIAAKVGKTVQFRVCCDKVDIQSPYGTIQAQGNVKVTSQGLAATGERMSIQFQEDSMVLEGKAQVKCQRDGQEIELRSDRFSLRLSEIQGATSTSTSNLQRPPIIEASREFP